MLADARGRTAITATGSRTDLDEHQHAVRVAHHKIDLTA